MLEIKAFQSVIDLSEVYIRVIKHGEEIFVFRILPEQINILASLSNKNAKIKIQKSKNFVYEGSISFESINSINEVPEIDKTSRARGKYSIINGESKYLGEKGWQEEEIWFDIFEEIKKEEVFEKEIIAPLLQDRFLSKKDEKDISNEGMARGYAEYEIKRIIKESVKKYKASTYKKRKAKIRLFIILLIIAGLFAFNIMNNKNKESGSNTKINVKKALKPIVQKKKIIKKEVKESNKKEEAKAVEEIKSKTEKVIEKVEKKVIVKEEKKEPEKIIEKSELPQKKSIIEIDKSEVRFGDEFIFERSIGKGLPAEKIVISNKSDKETEIKIYSSEGFLISMEENSEYKSYIEDFVIQKGKSKSIFIKFKPLKAEYYQGKLEVEEDSQTIKSIKMSGRGIAELQY